MNRWTAMPWTREFINVLRVVKIERSQVMKPLPPDASTWYRPSDSRLAPNADSVMPDHRHRNSHVCISWYQSRHRQNLIWISQCTNYVFVQSSITDTGFFRVSKVCLQYIRGWKSATWLFFVEVGSGDLWQLFTTEKFCKLQNIFSNTHLNICMWL
jgi:hypothetical protein